MSASQDTETRSVQAGPVRKPYGALIFDEDRACYELTAEKIRFYFSIRHLSRRIDLLVDVRPYRRSDAMELQRSREPYVQAAKDESGAQDVKNPAAREEIDFCNRYLIEVTHKGKPVSKETLDRLDAGYSLRRNIVREGFQGIHMLEEDEEREVEDIEEALSGDCRIPQFFLLADSEGGEHRVEVAHVLRAATVQDSLDWAECRVHRHSSGGRQRITMRYERIEQIYDRMALSVEGFRFKGRVCDASNRKDWLPLVPYFSKIFAMMHVFGEAKRGNG